MTFFPEQVPEHHGEFVRLVGIAQLLRTLDERLLRLARGRDAGEIALDVGGEHRNTRAGKSFRQHLQRHRLAGAGRAGHEAMTICQLEREIFLFCALADEYSVFLFVRRH
jgi:hypothetical protein